MNSRKYAQNLDTYSTWKRSLDPALESRFDESAAKPRVSPVFKIIGISMFVVILASVVTQLIAMSRFSTLGYEIERLQNHKASLVEEADKLRTAIATYETTKHYEQKAVETAMVKPEKMIYLQINDIYADHKSSNAGNCDSANSSACALADL